jgi:hypothetical protein
MLDIISMHPSVHFMGKQLLSLKISLSIFRNGRSRPETGAGAGRQRG